MSIDINCVMFEPQKSYLMIIKVPVDKFDTGIYSHDNLDRLAAGLRDRGINATIMQLPEEVSVNFVEQIQVEDIVDKVVNRIKAI
jgi:hypothetical protein